MIITKFKFLIASKAASLAKFAGTNIIEGRVRQAIENRKTATRTRIGRKTKTAKKILIP